VVANGKVYMATFSNLLRVYGPHPPALGPSFYLSDLASTSAVSGWGPVEKDMSNGEQAAGDGRTITIKGVTYAKGLGMHANADVRYALGGTYTSFVSDVGVDDETGNRGSVVFQVWLDGVKAFDSGVVHGGDSAVHISLPVNGVQELRLVVTDGGDGINFDHADWAGARLTMTGSTYVSDLAWTSAVSGWGPVEKDMSNGEQAAGDGHTITIKGVAYNKGLGVHANSDVRYQLGGAYSLFVSDVGVDDETGNRGSAVFQVWLDGVKAYDSGIMRGGAAAAHVNLSVRGAQELRLVVAVDGDGIDFDHADWAGASLR
jgi:alpha-galactosidase